VGAATSELLPSADAMDLVTLPGKKALIRRSFRPPNLETLLEDLKHALTPNESLFVRYHLPVIPEVPSRTWRLRIGGASVNSTLEISLTDLQRNYPRVNIVAVNQCSGNRRGLFVPRAAGVQWTNGAVGNVSWTGVRLRDVLDRAGLRATALEVIFSGADSAVLPQTPDFSKSLPIERARDDSTLIAFEMNGKPLSHWHGAPARLVVPGWTATYWVKHLTDIRVEPRPYDGYWMRSAYRLPANAFASARFATQETADTWPITDILVNSLITSHRNQQRLRRGEPAQLRGWAWDGGSGIAAVRISSDSGKHWHDATLGDDMGRFAWREFSFPIDTAKPGRAELLVRARSRSGAEQPRTLTPNPSGYHHNVVQRLELEIV
jgi:DMSO/TMAO reductase YedYZ molybdopterin-dependent catalytic subunit